MAAAVAAAVVLTAALINSLPADLAAAERADTLTPATMALYLARTAKTDLAAAAVARARLSPTTTLRAEMVADMADAAL